MIRLTGLNKYFNKGKSNQIHVIANTSLKFPEKGLVAITGPSGCGKTTLLNVIGGLDSFTSGEIDFDGQVLTKYKPLEWDILRNHYVGYIFQNYNLISNKTVYENIETVLNMAGLYDKEKIEERINYVLEAVGMYNYRRRNVKALSGGQQQRVAIARAIAKNPKVVLADEPTGNLDANNTFEIMSIIKKISQTCLVILVSHERHLVDFYADRVIEISDGKVINDYENEGNKSFEHTDERNIYLKDLNLDDSLKDSNIIRYYKEDKDDSLEFKVIEVKDSIYIKAETKSKKKIKFITDDTEIRLLDEHYKAKQSEEALDYLFDLEQYGYIETTKEKKSFIRFRDSFFQGFSKVVGKRKFIGKLFLLAYFVISALVVYQLATFASLTKVDDEDFLSTAKNLIALQSDEVISATQIDGLLNNVDGLEWSPYQRASSLRMSYYDLYQGNINVGFSGYPVITEWVDEEDLILGRMPENNLEIVIDKWIADNMIESKKFSDLGVTDLDTLLSCKVFTQNSFYIGFEIVGIINTESPIIVVEEEALYSFIEYYNAYPYDSMVNRIEIEAGGRAIENSGEILIPVSNTMFDIGDDYSFDGTNYEVVGKYNYIEESSYAIYIEEQQLIIMHNDIFVANSKNTLLDAYYYDEGNVYFYANDMEQAIEDIESFNADFSAFNSYEAQYNAVLIDQKERVSQRIQSIVVTLVGIIIYIFFMMRSSMLSRIKEIGIYRSIGATKRDIYKIFFGEIFWFTTLGSLTGYLAMAFLISRIQNMIGDLIEFFYFPIHYFVGGIVGIYLINLIFGLLPIFNLLRKTPSEINAKFDI
ncbi:MAG: ABC transporter ATP-binding protein/permease [Tenericutes bacterium]|nr:ABC transporter ATP-binding protein/permease [Mycoplasmatota bacterium]